MREEAAPTIAAAPGQNLDRYAQDLIARFANPALNHRLIQIAMDGSQKIPQRWLETLAIHQREGRQCPAILAGISAWIGHLRGANGPVDDPRAEELGKAANGPDPFSALFAADGLLASDWIPGEADRAALTV
jgi:fructuronate reductase